jgi:two-component system CheB/CheR fusion protein
VFRDTGPFVPSDPGELQDLEPSDDHLESLEDELRLTRHRLRSAIEELETANEELKSSNEEMMSMNEELQSTNEELSTVNDELKTKVDQLTVANSDLRNFYESTELAVVVLDGDLKVRSYTDAATRIFPLKPADRGRPLTDVASRLQDSTHLDDARAVSGGAAPTQRRVHSVDGQHVYSMRVLPYRTQTGQVDGATLVLTEITDALALERQLASERERLDLAIKAAGIGVWEYCPENGDLTLDPVERQLFEVDAVAPATIDVLLNRIDPEDVPKVEASLRRAIERSGDFEATFRLRRSDGEVRWVKGFGRAIAGSVPQRLVGVSIDVTPEYALAETRELMLREMNHRVKNLFAVIAGMMTIAARSHDDVRSFADDLRHRIAALGSAHSLASPAGRPHAVGLDDIVAKTLAPYREHARIEIDGPVVALDRSCLSPLALMLHEWATNSMKYGALGSGGEQGLHIRWQVGDDGIRLTWTEDAGAVGERQPGKRGFGSVLVETGVRQLRGTMTGPDADGPFRIDVHLPASVILHD